MKRILYKLLYFFPVFILLLSSCRDDEKFDSSVVNGEKPKAGFVAETDFMKVSFENKSTNGESYYWEFGDGTTSTEETPVHEYAIAGDYTVTLKVNSAAGYSDVYKGEPIYVAGKASPAFDASVGVRMNVFFDASTSANIKSAKWDFGDGSTGEGLTIKHQYASEGDYAVKLTITGLLDDEVELTKTITVYNTNDLIKGGNMEASAADCWTVKSKGSDINFGYTGDKPATGEDACLRFGEMTSGQSIIYQAVDVEQGKKYLFKAQIKAPGGASKTNLQFYIAESTDFKENDGNAANGSNLFLALNVWHGWGTDTNSKAVDGNLFDEMSRVGCMYGLGCDSQGVYTATKTGTVYIGIEFAVWSGSSNGDVLVDSVEFLLQN